MRLLYLQQIYINAGKIIMDKLFEKYKNYIDYTALNHCTESADYCCIYDNIGSFMDALCRKIINKNNKHHNIIYIIMSPYHKSDVICGLLVTTNNYDFKLINYPHNCKANKLYIKEMTAKDHKYLNFSDELFVLSNKIQQEF